MIQGQRYLPDRYTNLKTSVEASEKDVKDAGATPTVVDQLKVKVDESLLISTALQNETKEVYNAVRERSTTLIEPTRAALDEAEARVKDTDGFGLANYNFLPSGGSGPRFDGLGRLESRARSAGEKTSKVSASTASPLKGRGCRIFEASIEGIR